MIVHKRQPLSVCPVKVVLLGANGTGKTSTCRRLKGEIVNLSSSSSSAAIATSSGWHSVSKDLYSQAKTYLQFFVPDELTANPSLQVESESTNLVSKVIEIFQEAMKTMRSKGVRSHEAKALLHIEERGNQLECMDLLPAFITGPSLFLLFCNLINDLHSHCYRTATGETIYTVGSQL